MQKHPFREFMDKYTRNNVELFERVNKGPLASKLENFYKDDSKQEQSKQRGHEMSL